MHKGQALPLVAVRDILQTDYVPLAYSDDNLFHSTGCRPMANGQGSSMVSRLPRDLNTRKASDMLAGSKSKQKTCPRNLLHPRV